MALELKTAKQIRKYVESELAGISDEHPDLRIEAESDIERESGNIWWRLIGEEGPGLEDKDYTIEPCPERDEFLIWFGTHHVWGAFIGDEFTGTRSMTISVRRSIRGSDGGGFFPMPNRRRRRRRSGGLANVWAISNGVWWAMLSTMNERCSDGAYPIDVMSSIAAYATRRPQHSRLAVGSTCIGWGSLLSDLRQKRQTTISCYSSQF